jgi:hypothetical protein
MRVCALIGLGLIALTATAEAAERLVGKTLVCQSVGGTHVVTGWRSMVYLYVTPTNMFKQEAMRDPAGKITPGGVAMGTVYDWNKSHSGNAGNVTFRSYASKGVGRLSFDTKYRVPEALSDRVTMDVAQKATAQFDGTTWTLTIENRQSSPHGQVLVPFTRTSYRCQVKEGRHLL